MTSEGCAVAAYDLHLHSEWSYDAVSRIADYFKMARERSVRAIAITDHQLMDGRGDLLAAAAKYPDVGYLSGVEIAVHCGDGNYELVCLDLPLGSTPELDAVWELYHAWQRDRGEAVSANFLARGIDFDGAARLRLLKSYRPAGVIAVQGCTLAGFGAMMNYCIENGFCRDRDDFRRLCAGFTDLPDFPEADRVLPAIRRAGGVVILAHPNRYALESDPKRLERLREFFALDGIECGHASMTAEQTQYFRAYCRRRRLLSTGGSDLHEPVGEKFAVHRGRERWLDELLEHVTLRHGAQISASGQPRSQDQAPAFSARRESSAFAGSSTSSRQK